MTESQFNAEQYEQFAHAFHFIEKLKSSFAGAITAPDIEVTAAQCGVVVKNPTFITNFNVSW